MYIFGASGHGKVIYSILKNQNKAIDGFIDDDILKTNFKKIKVYSRKEVGRDCSLIIAVGDNKIRKKIVATSARKRKEKNKKKKQFLLLSQILANICRKLKRHSDAQDPQRARPQHTCQKGLDNFPRSTPYPTNTNGIYTAPSPGTTNSCCGGILG